MSYFFIWLLSLVELGPPLLLFDRNSRHFYRVPDWMRFIGFIAGCYTFIIIIVLRFPPAARVIDWLLPSQWFGWGDEPAAEVSDWRLRFRKGASFEECLRGVPTTKTVCWCVSVAIISMDSPGCEWSAMYSFTTLWISTAMSQRRPTGLFTCIPLCPWRL